MLDTTSHYVSWEIDTLGSPGTWSHFNDVAIIDKNNIWAVGDMYIIEDDGSRIQYNEAHWDGQDWEI